MVEDTEEAEDMAAGAAVVDMAAAVVDMAAAAAAAAVSANPSTSIFCIDDVSCHGCCFFRCDLDLLTVVASCRRQLARQE